MHERNIFRDSPPNFKQLAQEYNELLPYICTGLSGKPYINFKDPASLRALSTVLLKKYFHINIEIPLDRLIPTIPLRLNYVHWVEDLLSLDAHQNAIGIDIGCGASCIYSLLVWKLHNWKMITTEIDDVSFNYAVKNVQMNNAEKDIKVVKNQCSGNILSAAVNEASSDVIDFTMCNPPFFSNAEEHAQLSRTNRRTPGPCMSTASLNESYTDGGEVEFVKKMIVESSQYKSKVRWYTTMLGRKSSLKQLKLCLKESDINTVVTTEFRQGRTMRWGLAWSFNQKTMLEQQATKAKKAKPFFLILKEDFFKSCQIQTITPETSSLEISSRLWDIATAVVQELKKLKVICKEIEDIILTKRTAYEINGYTFENTWSHQRAKRRKSVSFLNGAYSSSAHIGCNSAKCSDSTTVEKIAISIKSNGVHHESTNQYKNSSVFISNGTKRKIKCDHEIDVKKEENYPMKFDFHNESNVKLFSFSCTVGMKTQFFPDKSDEVVVISFLCTEGNREQFHQMFLYMKNVLLADQIVKKNDL